MWEDDLFGEGKKEASVSKFVHLLFSVLSEVSRRRCPFAVVILDLTIGSPFLFLIKRSAFCSFRSSLSWSEYAGGTLRLKETPIGSFAACFFMREIPIGEKEQRRR